MNFIELAQIRQSCRNYNESARVEQEKIDHIIKAAQLSPSACNGQPYHITVCTGELAKDVSKATMGMGMNKFTEKAPVMLVISEENYVASAAFGAKVKGNDYRSIDIGILCAYITCEAASLGLGSCILGWFDEEKIRKLCSLNHTVRIVISLGYPSENDKLRTKKRKEINELVTFR